jgi:hypothetical protein
MRKVKFQNQERKERHEVLTLIGKCKYFWPSIFVVVKKHGDLTNVFHYLKTFHKKPRKVNRLYEKLSRGCRYE